MQGKTAVELMATGNDSNPPKSVILYSNGKIYDKSGAALRIAVQLGFPYTLLGLFFLVPPFIRNFIYDYIARNRYRWFGKKDACMIPTPELKSLFLD